MFFFSPDAFFTKITTATHKPKKTRLVCCYERKLVKRAVGLRWWWWWWQSDDEGCMKWWWSDGEVRFEASRLFEVMKRAGCLKWWWSDDELRFEASRLFEQKEIDEVSRKGNWWSEQVVAAKEVGLAKSFCLFTFLAVLLSHKAGPVVQATEQSSIGACCRADGLRVSKGATTTRHLTNTYTNLGW